MAVNLVLVMNENKIWVQGEVDFVYPGEERIAPLNSDFSCNGSIRNDGDVAGHVGFEVWDRITATRLAFEENLSLDPGTKWYPGWDSTLTTDLKLVFYVWHYDSVWVRNNWIGPYHIKVEQTWFTRIMNGILGVIGWVYATFKAGVDWLLGLVTGAASQIQDIWGWMISAASWTYGGVVAVYGNIVSAIQWLFDLITGQGTTREDLYGWLIGSVGWVYDSFKTVMDTLIGVFNKTASAIDTFLGWIKDHIIAAGTVVADILWGLLGTIFNLLPAEVRDFIKSIFEFLGACPTPPAGMVSFSLHGDVGGALAEVDQVGYGSQKKFTNFFGVAQWFFAFDDSRTVQITVRRRGYQTVSDPATFCVADHCKYIRYVMTPHVFSDFYWGSIPVFENERTVFSSQSVPAAGNKIESYLWDFDDGSTSTERNPTHVFPFKTGGYSVELTVLGSEGTSSSFIQRLDIYRRANASIILIEIIVDGIVVDEVNRKSKATIRTTVANVGPLGEVLRLDSNYGVSQTRFVPNGDEYIFESVITVGSVLDISQSASHWTGVGWDQDDLQDVSIPVRIKRIKDMVLIDRKLVMCVQNFVGDLVIEVDIDTWMQKSLLTSKTTDEARSISSYRTGGCVIGTGSPAGTSKTAVLQYLKLTDQPIWTMLHDFGFRAEKENFAIESVVYDNAEGVVNCCGISSNKGFVTSQRDIVFETNTNILDLVVKRDNFRSILYVITGCETILLEPLLWQEKDQNHINQFGEIGIPVIRDRSLTTLAAVKARATVELEKAVDKVASVRIKTEFMPDLTIGAVTEVSIPSKGIHETTLRLKSVKHTITERELSTSFELLRSAEFPDVISELAKIKGEEITEITGVALRTLGPVLETRFPIIDTTTGANISVDNEALMTFEAKTFLFKRL